MASHAQEAIPNTGPLLDLRGNLHDQRPLFGLNWGAQAAIGPRLDRRLRRTQSGISQLPSAPISPILKVRRGKRGGRVFYFGIKASLSVLSQGAVPAQQASDWIWPGQGLGPGFRPQRLTKIGPACEGRVLGSIRPPDEFRVIRSYNTHHRTSHPAGVRGEQQGGESRDSTKERAVRSVRNISWTTSHYSRLVSKPG